MSIGFGRMATQRLSHVGLTLTPRRGSGRWWLRAAVVALVLTVGLAAGYVWREREIPPPPPVATSPAELGALRAQLEQGRLALRLSESRSHELERQIDHLNQKLAESQEQLTFVRKAREGRH